MQVFVKMYVKNTVRSLLHGVRLQIQQNMYQKFNRFNKGFLKIMTKLLKNLNINLVTHFVWWNLFAFWHRIFIRQICVTFHFTRECSNFKFHLFFVVTNLAANERVKLQLCSCQQKLFFHFVFKCCKIRSIFSSQEARKSCFVSFIFTFHMRCFKGKKRKTGHHWNFLRRQLLEQSFDESFLFECQES